MTDSLEDLQLVKDVKLIRLCQLVATFLTFYDHLITLDREVELIWMKRWSLSKLLFIVNRYLGGAVMLCDAIVFVKMKLSDAVSHNFFIFQGWASACVVWAMQVIMQLRVTAMYGHSRTVWTFLASCFLCEVAAMAVILGMTYKQIIVASEPIPGVIICTPVGIPDFFFVFWVPIVVFESILFLLVVIQGVGHLKERSCSWSPTTLMDVLVRDSILYFFLTLTTYITNAVVWMTMSSTWLEVPEGFALAATCIMGSRLVLNMREAFFNPFHEGGIFVLSALGSGRAGRASPDLQFQRHGSVRSRAMLDEIELGDANWAETSGVMKPLAQGDR